MNSAPKASLVERLWTAQGGLCFHCGKPMRPGGNQADSRSREHLFPQSRGGRLSSCAGIVLAHRSCNSARGAPEPTSDEIHRAQAIYRAMKRSWAPSPKRIGTLGTLADIWPTGYRAAP